MSKTIVHLITSMENGGAQEVLRTICERSAHQYKHVVFYIKGVNAYSSSDHQQYLHEAHALNVRGPISLVRSVNKLRVFINSDRAAKCIHGWMYHGNLLALFVKFFSPVTPVVFSIHNGSDQRAFTSLSGYIASRICAFFSGSARFTVFVSDKAVGCHVPYRHAVVIPNPLKTLQETKLDPVGLSTTDFEPSIVKLLCVARFDPIKNIGFLLDVIQELKRKNLRVCLRMAGEGMVAANDVLVEMIRARNLQDTIVLLGVLTDVSSVYAWADYTVLTSRCESFSNVLLESIATGTPFISSDVGIAEDLLSPDSLVIKGFEMPNWVEAMEQKLRARKSREVSANVRAFYQKISGVYAPERVTALYSDCWSKAMGL